MKSLATIKALERGNARDYSGIRDSSFEEKIEKLGMRSWGVLKEITSLCYVVSVSFSELIVARELK